MKFHALQHEPFKRVEFKEERSNGECRHACAIHALQHITIKYNQVVELSSIFVSEGIQRKRTRVSLFQGGRAIDTK